MFRAVELKAQLAAGLQVTEPASLPPLLEPEVKTAPQTACYSVEANSLVFSKPVKVGREPPPHLVYRLSCVVMKRSSTPADCRVQVVIDTGGRDVAREMTG